MRKVDADSHFMEPHDWMERHDPGLAEKIPPTPFIEYMQQSLGGDVFIDLPEDERPHPADMVPKEMSDYVRALLDATEGRTPSEIQAHMVDSGLFPAINCDATARLELIDRLGIDVQFLVSSTGHNAYKSAKQSGQPELALPALSAYNGWALEQVAGHTDRLMPVALVDFADVDWARTELTRIHEQGCRLFQLKLEPTGGRSLGHPDFEDLWSLAEGLEMGVVFHAAAGRIQIHPDWLNNGGSPKNFMMLSRMASAMLPQVTVSALIFEGVLERHPDLPFFILENGTSWVPGWLESADDLGSPSLGYRLPLKPSEYVQRQVRVTSLIKGETWRPSFDNSPDDVIVFSTDVPHPEGAENAEQLYLRKMQDVDESRRERFFGDSVADLLPASVGAAQPSR